MQEVEEQTQEHAIMLHVRGRPLRRHVPRERIRRRRVDGTRVHTGAVEAVDQGGHGAFGVVRVVPRGVVRAKAAGGEGEPWAQRGKERLPDGFHFAI